MPSNQVIYSLQHQGQMHQHPTNKCPSAGEEKGGRKPREPTAHSDTDETARGAVVRSAAGRVSSSGSSAGQLTPGNGQIGSWQEPLDGSASEQVTGLLEWSGSACSPVLLRLWMVLWSCAVYLCIPTVARRIRMQAGQLHGIEEEFGMQDLCKAEEGQRGFSAHVASMEVDGPPSGLPAGEAWQQCLRAAGSSALFLEACALDRDRADYAH